jgi:hypothetical protein
MPRKLVILNAMLLAVAAGSVAYVVRQVTAPAPLPQARSRPAAAPPAAPRPEEPSRPGPGAWQSVAARNLFSPTRSEAPPSTAGTATTSPAVKPNLFGVVLREGAPIAYLEDPTTKRVAGYRIGDNVGGGTVQTISADSVVINRPDGKLDVRLRDPSRPRPAPLPVAAPGVPGVQPGVALPGVIPPAVTPGVTAPQPGIVATPGVQPGQPPVPMRRPLPPNLLRRLPQGAPADASRQ